MTNKEAINVLNLVNKHARNQPEYFYEALSLAIGAIERDSKVDDITFHWNDEKHNFVTACNAFEDILKVYGRGVTE